MSLLDRVREVRRVFVFGAVLIDDLPSGRALGGAPFNFAYYTHGFQLPTRLISAVGRDADGEEILAALTRFGMSREWIGLAAHQPTGLVRVTVDAAGVPTFVLQEEAAYDHIGGRPAIGRGDLVYFGSGEQRKPVSRATLQAILRERGEALAFCDLNIRQSYYSDDILIDSLSAADILKVNEDELALIARTFGVAGAEEAIAGWLCEHYRVALLLVTRGERGAGAYLDGRRVAESAAPRLAAIADTVGAGDAFSARFVAELVASGEVAGSLEQAVRFASATCRLPGAIQEPAALDFAAENVY